MSLRDSVSVVIDTLMRNGYSQIQEFEADEEALVLLALSGYNPRALVQVLEVLQGMPNSENLSLNMTHPSPSERIANIERMLAGRQFRDTSSHRAYRFRNR
jgi:predicted Zn-dependent protease